jgi:glycerol uptake facilitator-like aquaporin
MNPVTSPVRRCEGTRRPPQPRSTPRPGAGPPIPLAGLAPLLGRPVGRWVLASLALRLTSEPVAHLGATVPRGSPYQSLGLEILLAFLLMVVILVAGTLARSGRWWGPLAIGAVVGLEALWAGPISGASMNPARSFGPALVGWHWSDHWVYWASPLLGAASGSILLQWLKRHHVAPKPAKSQH